MEISRVGEDHHITLMGVKFSATTLKNTLAKITKVGHAHTHN